MRINQPCDSHIGTILEILEKRRVEVQTGAGDAAVEEEFEARG
jgi:hypothetical protein